MLYLQQPTDTDCETPGDRLALAELTAIGLERALLAPDIEARCREIIIALTRDPAAATWVMRRAEHHLGCEAIDVEEAASWFAGCLVAELAASLVQITDRAGQPSSSSASMEWRLPALVRRFAEYDKKLAAIEARLEDEKLEALKELAYGASHEINNPLANIAARAQSLFQEEADPERQRKLSAIHRQAMRAHEMISDLMLFARPPKLEPASCDLREIVDQVVGELREIAIQQETDLSYETADQPVETVIDATQIAVAAHAVITNALEAVGDGGHILVAVRESEIAGAARAEISVRDDGPGISEEVRQHIFDPFFSGREAGRGLGFGLSKCWRIVTDHGGEVVVQRPPAGGAEFVIRLPLASSAASAD